MAEFHFHSRQFNGVLQDWLAQSKKPLLEGLKQYARLIVKEVITLTPPGDGTAKGLDARRQGERAIQSDLSKLFVPVRKAEADPATTGNLKRIHQRFRTNKGRVKHGPADRFKVYSAEFNSYLRDLKKGVGKLAAGWNTPAAKLGYKPPAWIWRHDSPGSVDIKQSEDSLSVVMVNKVPYASDYSYVEGMAYKRQNRKLRRILDNKIKQSSPFPEKR